MQLVYRCLTIGILCLLSGCSKTAETVDLNDSELPWGRPATWEKEMPLTPGFKY